MNSNNLFIYKIMVGDVCYIGSTCDIRNRIWKHKSDCYNKNCKNYNLKLYKTIREVYGMDWDKVKWSVIDCYYNVDKTFRKEIEQYYIDLFKSELNMIGVVCDYKQYLKQYRNENKEKIKEINKQYRNKNKQKLNQKITCGCGSTYTKRNKKRHEKSKKHQDYLSTIV